MFGGVTDSAVSLQRLTSNDLGRIGSETLRHRDFTIDIGRTGRQTVGSRPHRWASKRHLELSVGQVMLHGLEASNRHTELLAINDIGNRHRDHLFGQSDEQRSGGGSATIERSVRGLHRGVTRGDEFSVGFVPFDSKQTTSAVDRYLLC